MSFERRKVRVGRVVSDKMDKTVVVYIERRRSHRLYKKSIQVRKRYVAHDPENEAKLGDLVQLIESRPISKTKRWRVAEIIERGDVAEVQPDDIKLAEDVQVAQKLAGEEQEAALAAANAAVAVAKEAAAVAAVEEAAAAIVAEEAAAVAAAAAAEAVAAEPEATVEPEAVAEPEAVVEAEPEAKVEPEAAAESKKEPEAVEPATEPKPEAGEEEAKE